MPLKHYNPVGVCIYCKQVVSKLSKEHIIPRGLGGKLTLPAASCNECAKITSRIELDCLRNLFEPARSHLKIQSRHNRNCPRKLLSQTKGEWLLHKDEETYPHFLPLPVFPSPSAYWRKPTGDERLEIEGVSVLVFKGFDQKLRAIDLEEAGVSVIINPYIFCRMLAKIAHAYAIAELGADTFQEFLPEIILGTDDKIAPYIGSGFPVINVTDEQHILDLKYMNNLLIVSIGLFSGVPAKGERRFYDVIVGHRK